MTSRRRLWRVALALLVLTALMLALVAWRAGEWLRGEIERRLQAHLVPTVTLAGPVSFSVLPRPSLVLRGLVLSGEDGAPLLAVRRLAVETGLDDLSGPMFTIKALRIDGVAAKLVRGADGRWNAAGWLKPSTGAGGAPPLRLDALAVDDARLRVEDAAGGVVAELQSLRLEAGPLAWEETATASLRARIALAALHPARGELQFEGQVTTGPAGVLLEDLRMELAGAGGEWVLERGRLAVDRVSVTLADGVRGEGVRGLLEVGGPDGRAAARLSLGAAGVSGERLRAERLSLEIEAEGGEAVLNGRLTAPAFVLDGASWHFPAGELEASAVLPEGGRMSARLPFEAKGEGAAGQVRFGPARVGLPHPGGGGRSVDLLTEGELRFDAELIAGHLTGSFDDSHLAGSWRYRPGAAVPLEVEATLDRLDADRYRPVPSPADTPTPLDAWLDLPVRAEVKVGWLRYQEVEGRDVRLRLAGGAAAARAPSIRPRGR